MASEIAGLVEEGVNGSEIAVFYRTNAQSRVLEDILVRQEIPYQVIGGPRFYERAEVKDLIAYLQVIDNPYDAVSLQRIANRPRRGIGDASLARLQTYADGHGLSLWEAIEFPEEAGLGPAQARAVNSVPHPAPVAPSRCAGAVGRRAGRAHARPQRLPHRARSGADDRGPGPDREPPGARRRRPGVPGERARPEPLHLPPGDLALLRPGLSARPAEPRHPDDAAQRQRAGVPRRVHDRDGGGDLPALPVDRGELARGGTAARLRRHDACPRAADADACLRPGALREPKLQPALALPRRAAAGGAPPRAAAAVVVVRLRVADCPDSASAATRPSWRRATPCATRRSGKGSSPLSSRGASSASASRARPPTGGSCSTTHRWSESVDVRDSPGHAGRVSGRDRTDLPLLRTASERRLRGVRSAARPARSHPCGLRRRRRLSEAPASFH